MADNDLDVLDPTGRNVTIAGQSLTVKPLTIGQLPRFVRAIRPAWPQLAGHGEEESAPDWLTLVAEHGEALIEAAAVATGMESKEIEALAPDEFVVLCGAIFEVNIDFFVRRLGPAIERASDRMVAAMARIPALIEHGAGATPSKPS
jgi:hypothetical protein